MFRIEETLFFFNCVVPAQDADVRGRRIDLFQLLVVQLSGEKVFLKVEDIRTMMYDVY